jgi:hypothetical protein
MQETKIQRRLRVSGLLVIAGLGVELFTLSSNHPLVFLAFLLLGCPLVLAGIVLYLHSLLPTPAP